VLYDAFISHASEDKEDFVRPLAERLRDEHIEVWYDEFSLHVGDGLRRSIDRGLAQSRFGIVVLSHNFFAKQWPQWELDGLVSRQMGSGETLILPIWRGLTRDDVLGYSPSLADKLAVDVDAGLEEVVRRLVEVIRPQGSTLVVARDFLLEKGFEPPVVTDDWWLDVAAAAESNDSEGTWQEAMGWGRWGFPLPEASRKPTERGVRLAWAALQMQWLLAAHERPITQITPPGEVLDFIESQLGLLEMCAQHPHYLTTYAPQLTIPGLAGPFGPAVEDLYQRSLSWHRDEASRGSSFGTATTRDGRAPRCSGDMALHDPDFGGYEAASVACAFVQGDSVASGPPVIYYSHIDYLAWLLSERSEWLGARTREFLTEGMFAWGVWIRDGFDPKAEEFGYEMDPAFAGKFGQVISRARSIDTLRVTGKARRDLLHRLEFSTRWLNLPEAADELAARVTAPEFLRHYFEHRERRRAKRKRT
jgi:TIR domain